MGPLVCIVLASTSARQRIWHQENFIMSGYDFRKEFQAEVDRIKAKHGGAGIAFDNDDQMDSMNASDKNNGWVYPLTKTEQKKEFNYVAAEQQRFLWRLQDGHLDVVEDYVENPKKLNSIDVNAYDEYGWTPLHYAAQMNYAEITKMLLKAGAFLFLKDKVTGMD